MKQLIKIQRPHEISEEEKRICQIYVDNDQDLAVTAKQVNKTVPTLQKLLNWPKCKTWIEWKASEKLRKDKLDYNYKLYKIKRVIEDFIPDDPEEKLIAKNVAVALSAISESNKMQGHYSAEKVLTANLNMDADLQKAQELMNEIIKRHQRDY